ncbi:hypothetical protein J41TS12_34910 [Paenibacillus antibioticophila]|uniref:Uncharacterized protein n=1 Tax=Paenibacillus antibioticophila TaxID=1274374 RepID=A0A919XYD6_9BACL|nr:hypothetical protein J41TS12_34910 [Paenibacillus antibioticophila]
MYAFGFVDDIVSTSPYHDLAECLVTKVYSRGGLICEKPFAAAAESGAPQAAVKGRGEEHFYIIEVWTW